ncbi:PAS domain-containing protein [Flagellimonas meridianipacifica]|uniref:PAS domain S-box-containing protein n=1 Tax=Flagellimonas meridianipacifica TaxID=1080225 RepID=A0A2T0MGT0_9FLAO|nr:PAS domain-containing protein [Allomuricauda pacifica]PRX56764.1 PAS domain S-box-containing protein [Allomuricauda pacifica]
MESTKFYDEALCKFYGKLEINSYPLSSLDIYAQHFNKVCKNLSDIKSLATLARQQDWNKGISLREEILDKDHVVVVTDPKLNIVYATQNIFSMNGYSPEEIIGNKPKMFQGEKTCQETSKQISAAIKQLLPFEATITNYRKNGSIYNCWIKGQPIFNRKGKVVNFIAFEKEVA